MENVKNVIAAEPGFVLRVMGYKDETRIMRELPVIGWAVTRGDPFGGRFLGENQRVLPVVVGGDALPITIEDLDYSLKLEGVEAIQYSYLKNGAPAYKKSVVPEPLKRRA